MDHSLPGLSGTDLPHIVTAPPGPRSRDWAARLARVESRNITHITDDGPVFWEAAAGANVRDVDGNLYIDLTAGFGVASAGHANARVAAAIASQATLLPHALGDVHPSPSKVRLLERLAAISPGTLSVSILGSSGAEAVEAALKTALLRTGRPGILAFERAYHGLTLGALAVTARPDFRNPFRRQLFDGVAFAPFPARRDGGGADRIEEDRAMARISAILEQAERSDHPVGAVIVEPIQGRGGLIVPTAGFLGRLRELCDGEARVLVFDEVYTGFGRSGRWFACEHWDVQPDILCTGKAMTGSLALSAAIGTPAVMSAWPPSSGEAIHTSTFLGNPVACEAALAQIDEIAERGLLSRAVVLGERIGRRTREWLERFEAVRDCGGLGLLQRVRLAPGFGLRVAAAALRGGVFVLAEGENAESLAITPPAVITEEQLDQAMDIIESAIAVGA
jgi:4-aminobutyrate aminotransferase-like enzyme